MANLELSEQELIRRQSLDKLRELGIEPYPAPLYPVNATSKQIETEYDPEKGNFQDVCIAGRIMSRRIMGAASFMELQDSTGRIQVYVKRDEICPGEDKTMYNTVFKNFWISVTWWASRVCIPYPDRPAYSSRKELTLLSKSLKVLPIVKEADGKFTTHSLILNSDTDSAMSISS